MVLTMHVHGYFRLKGSFESFPAGFGKTQDLPGTERRLRTCKGTSSGKPPEREVKQKNTQHCHYADHFPGNGQNGNEAER